MKQRASKETRSPDLFIRKTDQMIDFVFRIRKIIYAVVVLGFSIGLAIVGKDMLSSKREGQGARELFTIDQLKESNDKASGKIAGSSTKSEEKNSPSNEASKITQDELIKRYLQVELQYRGTRAGAIAALRVVELRGDDKSTISDSVTLLSEAIGALDSKELLYALLLMKKSYLQASAGQCEQAIQNWNIVINLKQMQTLHSEALLKSGTCYEQLGQIDKAREHYQKVIDSDKGEFANTAQQYLRLLQLAGRSKNG